MAETPRNSFTDVPPLSHPDGSPIRALVVDDEASLTELISMGLRMTGWEVATAGDGVHDRVAGLAAGGDRYVTKPFSMEEVMLRLHRLVQRSGVASLDNAKIMAGNRQPAPRLVGQPPGIPQHDFQPFRSL